MANLTVDFPRSLTNLTDPASQQQLIMFLSRFTEDIKSVLGNLEPGNFTAEAQKQLETMATASEKAQQLAKLLDDGEIAKARTVREEYKDLRDTVFGTFESIEASFSSLIEQTDSAIRSYVEANFIAADPDMTLTETITSLIEQTAEQIRLEFNTIADVQGDAIDAISVLLGTYFRFNENGLEIGKTGDGASPIVTRITNERIEFALAGTDVALVSIDTSNINIPSGTFGQLVAGIAGAQRLNLGYDANNDPYIEMYDNANNLRIAIRKDGHYFGAHTKFVEYQVGDSIGVGIFGG